MTDDELTVQERMVQARLEERAYVAAHPTVQWDRIPATLLVRCRCGHSNLVHAHIGERQRCGVCVCLEFS